MNEQELAAPASDLELANLSEVLRWRAVHDRERLAYRFLVDGESSEKTLTYGDLDGRARAIAALLGTLASIGDRAILIYPPGLEFVAAFFGCLRAGVAPIPIQAPHFSRIGPALVRLDGILKDARPAVAMTTSEFLASLEASGQARLGEGATRWAVTDGGHDAPTAEESLEADRHPEDVAFLQYTSGSTRTPRGVVVTHGNLMHNLREISECFLGMTNRGCVSWLPPFHDMGLIGGILAPLYMGAPVTLMSPAAFIQRPRRWLEAISRFKATGSPAPNFAYDYCVQKVRPAQLSGIDLSNWRVAFNGAEPVRARTLEEFAVHFRPCGFRPDAWRPCYGLAESTLLVSASPRPSLPLILSVSKSSLERGEVKTQAETEGDERRFVGCGQPRTTVRIVDPDALRPCPSGRVGEIWVSGPSVAREYWNRPAETGETFRAFLRDSGEGPYLRTGDLGFLDGDQLFVTGRLKDIIIIDGANHYPQDIEHTVGRCHEALEPTGCAAFSVEVAGREELVVVAALRAASSLAAEEIARAVRSAVSEAHHLRVHDLLFVKRGGIPVTSSGKIQRAACRSGYLSRTLEERGPR